MRGLGPLSRQMEDGDEAEVEGEGDGDEDEETEEHQFLWPLGRVREADGETRSRLFPLWRHHARTNEDGERETD